MTRKKWKWILISVVVLGFIYFVRPWIVYHTTYQNRWEYDEILQMGGGAYWDEWCSSRGLLERKTLDDIHAIEEETIFVAKKMQYLSDGIYFFHCDGVTDWATWVTLYSRFPISQKKHAELFSTLRLKGSDNNEHCTPFMCFPDTGLSGCTMIFSLPSPDKVEDHLVLEINGKEFEIEVETIEGNTKRKLY